MKRLFSIFRRNKPGKIDLFAPISKAEGERIREDVRAFAAASKAESEAEGAMLKAVIEQVAAEIYRAPIAFNEEGEGSSLNPRLQQLLNKPGNELASSGVCEEFGYQAARRKACIFVGVLSFG